jgi:hypothetical protein
MLLACDDVSCSLSVGIVFISYALHSQIQPFMDRLDLPDFSADSDEHVNREGAVLNYVSAVKLSLMVLCALCTPFVRLI